MRARELLKETLLRKRLIIRIHIIWLTVYVLFYLLPENESTHWGGMVFALSGLLLPLALSSGIFGDDIANGRIAVLMATPTPPWQLYGYRVLGLVLQGAGNIAAACMLIVILNAVMKRGRLDNMVLFAIAALFLFAVLSTLSTTLSLLLRRSLNVAVLGLAMVAVFVLSVVLGGSQAFVSRALLAVIKYGLPPVELLGSAAGAYKGLGPTAAVLGLTTALSIVYAVVGIVLLGRLEFSCAPE